MTTETATLTAAARSVGRVYFNGTFDRGASVLVVRDNAANLYRTFALDPDGRVWRVASTMQNGTHFTDPQPMLRTDPQHATLLGMLLY